MAAMAEPKHTDVLSQFYSSFQSESQALQDALETARSSSDSQTLVDALSLQAARLRKRLVDVTSSLPSHDRRQYEERMKSLEKSLGLFRVTSNSTSKFAFRRKQASPKPARDTATEPETAVPNPDSLPLAGDSTLEIKDRTGEHITSLSPSIVPSNPFPSYLILANLSHCIVDLSGLKHPIKAVYAKGIHNSVVLFPPVRGSAILHGLHSSLVSISCQQFRMHTSRCTTSLLHVSSTPIIEHSSLLRFGHFNGFESLPLIPSMSRHAQISDFDQLLPSSTPNWEALNPDEELKLNEKITDLVLRKTAGDDVEDTLACLLR